MPIPNPDPGPNPNPGSKPNPGHPSLSAHWVVACVMVAAVAMGMQCNQPPAVPASGNALYTSPQSNPLAVSPDGETLYVVNTTAGTLSVLGIDPGDPANLTEVAEIKVGHDPVSVAIRPKQTPGDPLEDELVLVSNHVSDTISVVSRQQLGVLQTVQDLDANGISTTNEPVGVVFDGRDRAFVALDHGNQVIELVFDPSDSVSIGQRLDVPAQAPRALAVAGGRLFVAAFESNNQTELPTCSPADGRGLNENNPNDEGCEFSLRVFASNNLVNPQLDTLFEFATGPNIGGRVIRDDDNPDRDLFVYDLANLASPPEVVEGVGTLLYGLASDGARVWVTNADARNHLDGLDALGNRMFDNRLSYVDCPGGSCGSPTHVDLDASAGGSAVVPTPYGVAVSADGNTLVVTGAGSDGVAPGTPGTPAGQPELFGLVTLDASGNVQGGVRVGAIPQGVALVSDGTGAAKTAYVLNTVDSTVAVVDVSTASSPAVLASAIPVGSDPTPAGVKAGRIAFSTARASTSGTFSCESCHPNGNMDQLLWTINTVNGPNDGPDPNGAKAEPRSTMPVRGLRDTLPLHWDGSLGDPIGGPNGENPGGNLAPNCNGADPHSCFRQLVNGSLGSVMCTQTSGSNPSAGCPTGIAGGGSLPGALSEQEREDMATFLSSVSFPPSPERRPSDKLSASALQGASDFFTDEDGLGIGGPGGVGQFIGFAPRTCADNSGGCHSLPLTVATNSPTVGAFDAPSIRGLWDRFLLFSNGIGSSEEGLSLVQDCADGIVPGGTPIPDDPCSPLGLNPFFPSGETIWDPAVGMTERGSFVGSFETLFSLVYGVPGGNIWSFINEMSVGLPALAGRQLELNAANATQPATVTTMDDWTLAAEQGRVTLVASSLELDELRYHTPSQTWRRASGGGASWSSPDLRDVVVLLDDVTTLTADLPRNVTPETDQPLLDIDPADRASESIGDVPAIPRPTPNTPDTFTLAYFHVNAAALVLLDGDHCDTCSIVLDPSGGAGGEDVLDLSLPGLTPGMHVVQVLNPSGLASNELPVLAQ